MASRLQSASRRGLIERFDSSIGAGSVLVPFGGKTQRSPAQAMAALMTLSNPEFRGRRPLFLGVDDCRFRKPVRPGDDLRVHAKILKISRNIGICRAEIRMDGNLVSGATLRASLAP